MLQSVLEDGARYNELLSVEAANEQVTRNQSVEKAEFLEAAFAIFEKYGLHDQLGVSLLHRHSDLAADERMVQFPMLADGERALVAMPSDHDHAEAAVPTNWALIDGEFLPIEYSTDPLAREIYATLDVPPALLDEYRDLVARSPIGEFFGIAIVTRRFFEQAGPDQFPLEYTDGERRANVIYLRSEEQLLQSIETAWSFREQRNLEITLGCKSESWCASRCVNGCWPDSSTQSHNTVHPHKHSPSYEHQWDGGP